MSSAASDLDTTETRPQSEFLRKIDKKIWGAVDHGKRKSTNKTTSKNDDTDSSDDNQEMTFYDMGRVFGRIADPYAFVGTVVRIGIRNDTAANSDDEAWLQEFYRDIEGCQAHETWKIWCQRFPSFCGEMLRISDARNGSQLLKKVTQKIALGINAVRGDDTAGLKGRILKYLPEDLSVPLDPPIAAEGNKSDRGWDHPLTARLLLPHSWEPCEVIYNDIKEGRKRVTAEHWPHFLYPTGRRYDIDDIESALFEGYLMLRVAKHIFQGPSAALERPGFHRGKRSNAQIIGITSMTPYTIAYVACQIRYTLSSQTTWSTLDVHFDYSAFFWNIVHCFDGGEGQATIDVFNYHVFGPAKNTSINKADDAPEISDLQRMKNERARKRARMSGSA